VAEILNIAAEIILAKKKALLGTTAILTILVTHTNLVTIAVNRNDVVRRRVRVTDEVDANRHLGLLLCL